MPASIKGFFAALALLLFGQYAEGQTIPLYAGNVAVPSTILSPFTFTIPPGKIGTLWIGDAGASAALRAFVFVYTMDGKFYESFSAQGTQILNWPGLPPGDYQSIASFMWSGGGSGSDYFVANIVIQ